MTTKVIILNGPPGSGKDDATKHLTETSPTIHHNEFKKQLITLTKQIWGVTDSEWDEMYTRENKEIPTPVFDGMSPRQALIHTSEVVIKPNYGNDYFGRFAAKSLQDDGINVFSDGGFVEETHIISDAVGSENLMVVRIKRPGYTFEGDTRNYLPDTICTTVVDVDNDGSLDEFFNKIRQVTCEWLLK